jgi:hypothetical protein
MQRKSVNANEKRMLCDGRGDEFEKVVEKGKSEERKESFANQCSSLILNFTFSLIHHNPVLFILS